MAMNLFISLALILSSILVVLVPDVKAYQCDVPDNVNFSNVSSRHLRGESRWPNGIVKYKLDKTLTANDLREVIRAIGDIQSKTCIKFLRPAKGENDYTRIEVDNNFCGFAHIGYMGIPQFAKFGGSCRNWNTMVHELGHTLCLGHEHARRDRDDYLSFNNCNPSEIPGKDRYNSLIGSLYDYTSQMHYCCGWCGGGWCGGGWPKQNLMTRCGPDVQQGLSVMDADKLNDLYDCAGCYGHRWRPIDSLTDQDKRNLVRFGTSHNLEAYYACRGVLFGELCIGKYSISSGICYLSYGGWEYHLRRNAQVFTNPSGGSSYRVINIRDYKDARVPGKAVRSGNTLNANVGYIAVANIVLNGRRELAIGKVFEGNWNEAYFPIFGREVKTSNFGIVVCE